MEGYLGEEIVTDLTGTPFEDFGILDWILYFVEGGRCDGSHHKHEALDDVARVALDTEIEVRIARWSNGEFEYRVYLKEPTEEYEQWCYDVEWSRDGDDW